MVQGVVVAVAPNDLAHRQDAVLALLRRRPRQGSFEFGPPVLLSFFRNGLASGLR